MTPERDCVLAAVNRRVDQRRRRSSLSHSRLVALREPLPRQDRRIYETAWREALEDVSGLPEGFRIHDLRHYFASLLIAAGLDIKTVQAASAIHPRRPRWTPTGACGQTETSPHAQQ